MPTTTVGGEREGTDIDDTPIEIAPSSYQKLRLNGKMLEQGWSEVVTELFPVDGQMCGHPVADIPLRAWSRSIPADRMTAASLGLREGALNNYNLDLTISGTR